MAAQYGTVRFAQADGQVVNRQIYFDDTAGHLVKWDAGAGALNGSDTFIPLQPMVIRDVCIAAATGQTQTQIAVQGNNAFGMLLNALHLASITNRPAQNIFCPAGLPVRLIQVA